MKSLQSLKLADNFEKYGIRSTLILLEKTLQALEFPDINGVQVSRITDTGFVIDNGGIAALSLPESITMGGKRQWSLHLALPAWKYEGDTVWHPVASNEEFFNHISNTAIHGGGSGGGAAVSKFLRNTDPLSEIASNNFSSAYRHPLESGCLTIAGVFSVNVPTSAQATKQSFYRESDSTTEEILFDFGIVAGDGMTLYCDIKTPEGYSVALTSGRLPDGYNNKPIEFGVCVNNPNGGQLYFFWGGQSEWGLTSSYGTLPATTTTPRISIGKGLIGDFYGLAIHGGVLFGENERHMPSIPGLLQSIDPLAVWSADCMLNTAPELIDMVTISKGGINPLNLNRIGTPAEYLWRL